VSGSSYTVSDVVVGRGGGAGCLLQALREGNKKKGIVLVGVGEKGDLS